MSVWIWCIPFLSALIGWLINKMAIKMLFHPAQPKKFLGISFQGIYPKRQEEIGEKLGKLVSREFFSSNELEQKIASPENLQKILPTVDRHIDDFLHNKLGKLFPMISMFIGEKTIGSLKAAFMTELEELFPIIMQQFAGQLKNDLDMEQIVALKINEFSSERLESLLHQGMAREFRIVEILGAVSGFIIGSLQVVITLVAG